MKIEVPDRLGKWLYKEPSARGSRNGPRKGPGRPAKRAFVENLPHASVRECPSSAKRDPRGPLDRVVRAKPTRGPLGMERKAASWKALAELYKRLPIEVSAARADRARARRSDSRKPGEEEFTTCVCDSIVISKDTRRTESEVRRPTCPERRPFLGALSNASGTSDGGSKRRADDARGCGFVRCGRYARGVQSVSDGH